VHLAAAREAQQHALLLRFHSLDDDPHAQRAAERDDRLDDHAAIGRAIERGHEAPIDLQFVEGKLLQIAQAGITRPEIVKRELHAECPQLHEPRPRFVRIVDYAQAQHRAPARGAAGGSVSASNSRWLGRAHAPHSWLAQG
jgi:hypothetical protein